MRTLAAVFLATLLAGSLSAQRRGGGPVGGFGNVVFPGTGSPPARSSITGFGNVLTPGMPRSVPNFSITDPSFARGLGGVVSGKVPYTGVRGGFGKHGGFGGSPYVYVPYAYPAYGGDFYGAQQPQVVVVYPQQQQQPPVAIHQSFGGAPPAPEPQSDLSDLQVYQAPTRSTEEMAAAVPTAPYYLIAFKDHSIYSAVAYWIDGDTLHYFTSGNNHNQVSMALVDRELTERLNRERNVSVRLPK